MDVKFKVFGELADWGGGQVAELGAASQSEPPRGAEPFLIFLPFVCSCAYLLLPFRFFLLRPGIILRCILSAAYIPTMLVRHSM